MKNTKAKNRRTAVATVRQGIAVATPMLRNLVESVPLDVAGHVLVLVHRTTMAKELFAATVHADDEWSVGVFARECAFRPT